MAKKLVEVKEDHRCPVCWNDKLIVQAEANGRIYYKCKCGCEFSVLKEE